MTAAKYSGTAQLSKRKLAAIPCESSSALSRFRIRAAPSHSPHKVTDNVFAMNANALFRLTGTVRSRLAGRGSAVMILSWLIAPREHDTVKASVVSAGPTARSALIEHHVVTSLPLG
jgi:hypothetical protein